MLEQLSSIGEKLSHYFGGVKNKVSIKATDNETIEALFDYQTLYGLLPYREFDDTGDMFMNKHSMGFMLELSPLLGADEETVNILSNLLVDVIPDHVDGQFLQYLSPKIAPIVNNFKEVRTGQSETRDWLSAKRAEFLKAGALSSLSKQGSFMVRDIRLFLSLSLPVKHEDDDKLTLIQLRDDIESSLKALNIQTQRVNARDFINLMRDLLFPTTDLMPSHAPWNEMEELSSQMLSPEFSFEILPDRLVVKHLNEVEEKNQQEETSWDIRVLNVQDFPETMAQWKMTDAIGAMFNNSQQVPCPLIVSMNFRTLSREKSMSTAQIKVGAGDSKAKTNYAKFMPNLGRQIRDWAFIRDRLTDNDCLVQVCYQIVVMAESQHAAGCERKIRDLYQSNGWRLAKQKFLQFPSWQAIWPMLMSEGLYQDFRQLGKWRQMTAFNVVNIAPLQGEWKGTRTPLLLLAGRRGQLSYWSPFDSTDGNYNVAIAAKSGSGKSVFTQEYIVGLLSIQGRVWVIDQGRSYEKTCRLLQGEFIAFNTDNPICINPFTHIQDFKNEALPQLKPLLTSMARPNDKASREEENFIEKAITASWETYKNDATISRVVEWLEEQSDPIAKNLSLLLFPYSAKGMYARYFEGTCNLILDNPFIVLELQELKNKKELQKVVLFVMMYHITQAMYLGNRSQYKSCIIDEAWDLLGGDIDGAKEFIEAGYRTARRFNGNFVTITQSINDYYKNSASMAAFENSDFNVILGQKSDALQKLKNDKKIELDGYSERLYKSLKVADCYSECVIKSSQGVSPHRIVLDPYSRILFSSKGHEFEAVNKLVAQGRSVLEAVESVVEQQKRTS
ncbi:MAG: type IV secretion system protein TraC [Gammaproteobacteria bacterium]|nr:type IV secretion system protein TraC [Gammaproteobacteria bacterium]